MSDYTDLQRKEITRAGYRKENWKIGHKFSTNDSHTKLGTVTQMVRGRDGVKGDNPNGLDALVVKDPKTKTIRIIYQGSQGDPMTSKDWVGNDYPMMAKISTHDPAHNIPTLIPTILSTTDTTPSNASCLVPNPTQQALQRQRDYYWQTGVTGQLKDASKLLKKTLKDNPGYQVEVYGHSLGSMDGQYAVASLNETEAKRIKGTWLYEGPNIYPALPDKEKKRARSYGNRVKNYVDRRDIVARGFADDSQTVGVVQHVDSKDAKGSNPIDHYSKQHSWGGYQWASDGTLSLTKQTIDATQLRAGKSLTNLRSHWEKNGGTLTDAQKIFLDYQQALSLLTALRQELARTETAIKTTRDSCTNTANTTWYSDMNDINSHMVHNSSLTWNDLIDMANQEGCSMQRFAHQATASIDAYLAKVKKVHENLNNLEQKTITAINTLLHKDATLATKFRQWDTQLQETSHD